MIIDLVTVTVIDDPNYPSFNLTPSNTTISELSSGNFLTWNASDDSPDTYFIYLDDVEIETNPWITNNNITVNLDPLDLGIYNYTIVLKVAPGADFWKLMSEHVSEGYTISSFQEVDEIAETIEEFLK